MYTFQKQPVRVKRQQLQGSLGLQIDRVMRDSLTVRVSRLNREQEGEFGHLTEPFEEVNRAHSYTEKLS